MIICHKHKFIFIKTRKTAGTSIETALANFCDDTDVITALSEEDEATRVNAGIRSAQNLRVPLRQYGKKELLKLMTGERTRFYNHIPASEVQRIVSANQWNQYFVFAVERNPFDRAISQYFWKNRKSPNSAPSMPLFFEELSDLNMSNWAVYTENNQPVVDRVLRYENLAKELNEVGELLGINIDISEVHAKGWTRTDRRHYSEVLDVKSRSIIERRCANEIAYFGYQWNRD